MNYALRYIAEEILVSPENIDRLKSIMELPIDEAIELVDNDLADDEDLGLNE